VCVCVCVRAHACMCACERVSVRVCLIAISCLALSVTAAAACPPTAPAQVSGLAESANDYLRRRHGKWSVADCTCPASVPMRVPAHSSASSKRGRKHRLAGIADANTGGGGAGVRVRVCACVQATAKDKRR